MVWLLVVGCGLLLWLEYRDRGLKSRATLVRATVSVKKLVEPLVVPILTILATPLSCSDLQYFLGPTSSCSGAEAMLMVVFAAVTLLVWLPLQFTFTLLLVEQDPNSPRVTAAVNGRAQTYGLIGRVVLALGPAVAPHVIELWVVAAALGFMALAVFVFQVRFCVKHGAIDMLLQCTSPPAFPAVATVLPRCHEPIPVRHGSHRRLHLHRLLGQPRV